MVKNNEINAKNLINILRKRTEDTSLSLDSVYIPKPQLRQSISLRTYKIHSTGDNEPRQALSPTTAQLLSTLQLSFDPSDFNSILPMHTYFP
jgi:hypothetical protein